MTDPGSCGAVHCITCSDEGVPMRVVADAGAGISTCAGPDGPADVMTDLVGPVAAGDLLLVHAGVALVRLEDDG